MDPNTRINVACPICQAQIPSAEINQHLDNCLRTTCSPNKRLKTSDSNNNKFVHKPENTPKTSQVTPVSPSFKTSPVKRFPTYTANHLNKSLKKIFSKDMATSSSPPNQSNSTSQKKVQKTLESWTSSQAIHTSAKPNFDISADDLLDSGLSDCQAMIEEPLVQTNSRPQAVKSSMPSRVKSGKSSPREKYQPLAEQTRPVVLDDYEGQEKVLGEGTMLRKLIASHEIPSMILWGPPGCGKTSLAHIISEECKKRQDSKFVKLSATMAGVKDVKEVVERAKNDQAFKCKTILFIDEIHRFNKMQQDAFLPHVESGTITLIGATTENPSFVLNNALLSRCRVIVMEKLSVQNIERILEKALQRLDIVPVESAVPSNIMLNRSSLFILKEAVKMLAEFCDGDARIALNGLQMAVQAIKQQEGTAQEASTSTYFPCSPSKKPSFLVINKDHIREGLQKTHLLYDRTGDQHYDTISAYIKSMRGSDANAALYWLARMLEGGEDPRFISRRLIIFASEDIGMADSGALNLATSTFQACQFVGMPESKMMLSHCTVYMAKAPKSRACCDAYAEAEKLVHSHQGPLPPVPLHLRNAPTRLMKDLGYGKGYQMYNHNGKALPFLPEGYTGVNFFK